MPTLKDLVCHVQWADTGSAFPEYGTIYGDGVVETYIAVPGHPQAFTIRLTSRKFIYTGLAMVVFIDGDYQCNRNRVNLQPTKDDAPDNRTNIDFLVRQKEKPMGDGTYMGREWRFDDCNLGESLYWIRNVEADPPLPVSQIPDGVDQGHFDELGTIEVLVMRCSSNNREDGQCSTTSSAEHSGIMNDDEDAREEQLPGGDSGGTSDAVQIVVDAEPPQTEAQDAFGGLFGLFDGPADGWSSFAVNSGDAPSGGYSRWHWQGPGGESGPYGPQERSQHSPDYRAAPHHYGEPPRSRYDYHDSPSSSAYAHPLNPPPPHIRPERHVHFDYGDRARPPLNSYTAGYDHQPHHTWTRDDRPAYSQPRPSHGRPEYHRHRNSHPDYPVPPGGGHYMYNADREIYSQYPDPNQIHGSFQQHTPMASHSSQHSYYQPPTQGVSHEHHQAHGPQTFGPSPANLPGSAPSVIPFPPLPPRIPIQPTNLPPIQPQPINYPVPIWVHPPTMPVPPFPTAMPIYPPLNNAPLFQTQKIDASNVPSTQNDSTVAPGGIQAGSNGDSPQQQGGDNANIVENNNSNTVQTKPAEDPLQNTKKNSNDDGWPTSGNNNWTNDNGRANGGVDDNASNKTGQNLSDAGSNENSNNTFNNEPNGDDIGQNWGGDNSANTGTGRGWEDEPTNNGTGQGWENENTNAGGSSWQQEPTQNNTGNQQSNNDDGWANENQNTGGGGNTQAGNGSNNPQSGSISNITPASDGNPWNSRSLYGPHGAYYTSKASAQNAPPAEAEEEPRYDVPQAIAQSIGVTKQVQPGKGYLYNKKRCVPHYLDSLDEPYARFVFKYRTKEQLKDEIGVEITAEPSPNEDINALENLDKAELIQLVLRAKGALGGTIPSPPPKVTPTSVNSFEQVPVDAPDVGFLRYSLPRMRNASNVVGLGIGLSPAPNNQNNGGNVSQGNSNSNNKSNWNKGSNNDWQTGNSQQNTSGNNGGSQNWQENNQSQPNNSGNNQSWGNGGGSGRNNNNSNNSGNSNSGWNSASADNKNGWDGQQEKQARAASHHAGNFNNAQGTSRRSSAISPKGQISAQGYGGPAGHPPGDLLDYVLNNPQEAARMGMTGPPPPAPPTVAFTRTGTVGGGQTNFDMSASSGAGPRPATPTEPPPPCSPLSVQDPGGFGTAGWGMEGPNPAAPSGGW
ncbi:hypothetical protein AYO20_01489 [Fonsecaea nubica]|uniref:Uncharacterized protein n=1 Tax=Fonsecaea nubica TaxID=856822 RepID=A0A178DD78_9EURO|nr:hypothetical protein AYO20_01489 [Fonsecaea nubica]OAL39171.1 hypothetical protein AYO20_01489 [Fonsecaea nubica]